jgi:hypothetical protein
MRRSIWTSVAATVLLLIASATLPHADLRTWSAAVPAGARGLFMPSWPVMALRTPAPSRTTAPLVWPMPSWPVPALRSTELSSSDVRTPARTEAGPLTAARRAAAYASFMHVLLAIGLGVMVAAGVPLIVARGVSNGSAGVAHRVHALAERGLSPGHIARRSGLPRDAVRSLLLSHAPSAVRKRA